MGPMGVCAPPVHGPNGHAWGHACGAVRAYAPPPSPLPAPPSLCSQSWWPSAAAPPTPPTSGSSCWASTTWPTPRVRVRAHVQAVVFVGMQCTWVQMRCDDARAHATHACTRMNTCTRTRTACTAGVAGAGADAEDSAAAWRYARACSWSPTEQKVRVHVSKVVEEAGATQAAGCPPQSLATPAHEAEPHTH